MSLATVAAIRDRVLTVIEALTPTSLASETFGRYLSEAGDEFETWAQTHASISLRRIQVRQVGNDEPPLVTDTATERVRATLEIRVAYPQTGAYGNQYGLDRDDVINEDWKLVDRAVGLYGRGNFSGSNDCTPLGARMAIERGKGGTDYMAVTADFEYLRSI